MRKGCHQSFFLQVVDRPNAKKSSSPPTHKAVASHLFSCSISCALLPAPVCSHTYGTGHLPILHTSDLLHYCRHRSSQGPSRCTVWSGSPKWKKNAIHFDFFLLISPVHAFFLGNAHVIGCCCFFIQQCVTTLLHRNQTVFVDRLFRNFNNPGNNAGLQI